MEPRIWLIAGPTASGKSALALRLAAAVGGEIVNADSMQLYADLRLLTALYSKPAEGSPVLAVPRMSITLGFAILLAASATLLLGVVPRGSLDLAQRGASTFFAAAPPSPEPASAAPALKGN